MKGSGSAVACGIPSPSKSRSSRRWTVRSISLGGRSSRTATVKSSPGRSVAYTSCWYNVARRNKNTASLAGASRSVTRKTRCPCPSLPTRAVILKTASNIYCSSLCTCDCMSCGHPFVPGCTVLSEPCSPERAVYSLFLEHGEWWDEHLVDDVHDPVVRDPVRPK